MGNLTKILLIIGLFIFYTGCSTRDYKLGNNGIKNQTKTSDILFNDKLSLCKTRDTHINLNITYSDDFEVPMEYISYIGFSSGSWDESKYNEDFKSDFENTIKQELKELCNYNFNKNPKSIKLNLLVNKIKVVPEDINIENNYIIPLVGIWRLKYDFKKNYLYEIKLSGDYFNKNIEISKNFNYIKDFKMSRNFLSFEFSNMISFKEGENEIFYFDGSSGFILLFSNNGMYTMKLNTLDKKTIYKENIETTSHMHDNNNLFLESNTNYIADLFFIKKQALSQMPYFPDYWTGPLTYLTYDIINEIITKANK